MVQLAEQAGRSSEGVQTVLTGHPCGCCGAELTNRREYCNAACRSSAYRQRRAGRVAAILQALKGGIAALEAELLGEVRE